MWILPEIQAPFPDNEDALRQELAYLQTQLEHWNQLQSNPRRSVKLKEWIDFDDGISIMLEARRTLIKMRERWANREFKHGKPKFQGR